MQGLYLQRSAENESKCGAPRTYAYHWLPLVAIIVHHFLHLGFMWDSCGYPSLWFIPTWYLWLSTRRFHVLHVVNSSTNDLCHVQGSMISLSKSKKKNMLGQLSAAMACVTALYLTWGLHPRTSFDSTSQAFHKWPQVCHLWLQSGVLEMKDGNSWNSWSMSQSNPNWRMWLRTNSLACPQWQWNPSHLQPTYALEGNKSSLTGLSCNFQLEVVLSPSTCHGWSSQGMKVPACPWNWPDMALSHSSHGGLIIIWLLRELSVDTTIHNEVACMDQNTQTATLCSWCFVGVKSNQRGHIGNVPIGCCTDCLTGRETLITTSRINELKVIVRAKFWSIRDGLLAQRSWEDRTEHKDAEQRLEEERWSGCHGARYSRVSERGRTIWKSQELAANTFQRDTPTQSARTTNCKLNQPHWSQDVLRQTAK